MQRATEYFSRLTKELVNKFTTIEAKNFSHLLQILTTYKPASILVNIEVRPVEIPQPKNLRVHTEYYQYAITYTAESAKGTKIFLRELLQKRPREIGDEEHRMRDLTNTKAQLTIETRIQKICEHNPGIVIQGQTTDIGTQGRLEIIQNARKFNIQPYPEN